MDSTSFWDDPFGVGDLSRLEEVPPITRLVLLALSGLWGKVPPERWGLWVGAAGAHLPFPPEGFTGIEQQAERTERLGAALGLGRAAVARRWYRGVPLLGKLDCIRSIRP